MTTGQKLAAIVALLKDGTGEWREDVNGADFVQDVSLLIDSPTTPDPVWWVVTLRQDGDDEDSLEIVEGIDEAQAVTHATTAFLATIERGDEDPTIYVNHVVRCVGPEPTHVRTAPV